MTIELRWLASMSASAFHAAEAVWRGESLADEQLQQALNEPTERLAEEIEAAGLEADQAVPLLAALAMGIENNRELVEVAITKIRGRADSRGELTGRIAGRIADLEAAFCRALPNVADQLALRGEPLKEQWEARGPGLLRHFARLTDELLVAPHADVALVYPALGGDGVAHLPYNTVRIEAVLANQHAQLPETVRLAWLLAQLQLDLPIYSDEIDRGRIGQLARLATLPAILDAAQYVELVSAAPGLVALALTAWRVVPQDDTAHVAEIVGRWWQTYQEREVPVRVALRSLDRLLCEAAVAAV